jgi:hypothetical protein
MLSRFPVVLLLSVILSVTTGTAEARKNRDLPHPHAGILSPYEPGPFKDLRLSSNDEKQLADGKSVMKQTTPKDGELGGGAICVQDIDAPKKAVWKQILDLDSYKGKVPKVNEAKNYFLRENSDGTTTVKTKMVLGVLPGYAYTAFYDHHYVPKRNSMIWTLDYGKSSDFDDVAGHWHLEEHPKKPLCTRVFYACDIKLAGSVPKPVVNFLSKSALKAATGWVKKESEKNPEGTIPSGFGMPAASLPKQ